MLASFRSASSPTLRCLVPRTADHPGDKPSLQTRLLEASDSKHTPQPAASVPAKSTAPGSDVTAGLPGGDALSSAKTQQLASSGATDANSSSVLLSCPTLQDMAGSCAQDKSSSNSEQVNFLVPSVRFQTNLVLDHGTSTCDCIDDAESKTVDAPLSSGTQTPVEQVSSLGDNAADGQATGMPELNAVPEPPQPSLSPDAKPGEPVSDGAQASIPIVQDIFAASASLLEDQQLRSSADILKLKLGPSEFGSSGMHKSLSKQDLRKLQQQEEQQRKEEQRRLQEEQRRKVYHT